MVYSTHIDVIEKEYNDIEKNKAWDDLYLKVKSEGTYSSSCSIARSNQNKYLNRYRDVLPYDHTRVPLLDSSDDYINASFVENEDIQRKYILTQGPLSSTTAAFWLMIWQQKTKGVIMLNKIIEKDQVKCDQYWPLGESRGGKSVIEHNSVNLKVELLKEVSHSHYKYRSFKLSNIKTGEHREVLHFHYTTWPDFGVPNSPASFFEFLQVVRNSDCLEPQHGPAVIHCSAGIGRSGTFCLVDTILKMLSDGLCDDECGKVLEVLLHMRTYRMGLIQTSDQLRFSYQAIVYGARSLDTVNVKDPTEESSTEEVSLDEPPPPPPRLDSLTVRSMPWSLAVDNGEESDSDELEDLQDDCDRDRIASGIYQRDSNTDANSDAYRPLPFDGHVSRETSPHSSTNSSANRETSPHSSTNSPANGEPAETSYARKRRHYERLAATCDKIHEIKEKSLGAEAERDSRRFVFSGISVCSAILFIGLGAAYFYRQLTAA